MWLKRMALVRRLAGVLTSPGVTMPLLSGRSPILDALLYQVSKGYAVSPLDLGAFVRNPDGTWSVTREVTVRGPRGRARVLPGQTITSGVRIAGLDLVDFLERRLGKGNHAQGRNGRTV